VTREPLLGVPGLRPELLLDGAWRAAAATFAVGNPATGERIADVADAGLAEVDLAVAAAAAALPGWAATPGWQRYRVLADGARLLAERVEAIARVMSLETGKPIAESVGEMRNTVRFLEWYSHEAARLPGEYWPGVAPGRDAYVVKEPVGVVAAITPWNFPGFMVACKVGAALAAGCAVVLKPAEQTPLTALAIAAALHDAGLPAGVLGVLTTSDPATVGTALVTHPDVACVTFTGSTAVGERLLALAAPAIKRVLLELGGNAPVVVLDDAVLDDAVAQVVRARYLNAGQACVAANRVYVQRGIAEAFTERFVAAVRALRPGDPFEAGTDLGPLIELAAVERLERQVATATEQGARLATGGARLGENAVSAWLEPAVLVAEGRAQPAVLAEEFFGPVASVVVFDTEDEGVALANDTRYGLAAYVFAGTADRGLAVARRIRSGSVGVNGALVSEPALPFGGMGESGLGRERGRAGIEEFLETKTIQVAARG